MDNHSQTPPTAHDLLERCRTLLSELEEFKEYIKTERQDHTVEIAHFRNTVKSEHRTLVRLNNEDADQDAAQHTVNSSNLPFLECVWNTVKSNRGLQALQKRFYWNQDRKRGKNKKQESALVDVVTNDGLLWLKVSLLSNTRLLFDKAKQGWEDASSDDDDDSSDDEDDEENQVPLVKIAGDLLRAAHQTSIRTRHPRVTFILPRIQESQIPEIDAIIAKIRNMGATVYTSTSAPPTIPLSQVMTTLLTHPFDSLTPTLNIDCTLLLALVSDFSHCSVEAEPWFHRALKRQVEIEDRENLLPSLLYPAMLGRDLICTREAAKRMREIVDTIGTAGERARTKLLMGVVEKPTAELQKDLQDWSRFPVPESLHLPIHVVESDIETLALPPSASFVKENLSPINQSVFLHGWGAGVTTITSNRTVVRQIENLLEKYARDEKDWPSIWLCPTARSLVGKEKGRRD